MLNGTEDFILKIKERAMEELFADYELHGIPEPNSKKQNDRVKEYLKKVSEINFPAQCSTHNLVNKIALLLILQYVKRLESEIASLSDTCDTYWETICDLIEEKEELERKKKKHWFSRTRK